MKTRDYLNLNVWLLPVLTILLPVALLFFGSSFFTTSNNFYFARLQNGWSVRHGDFLAENVNLDNINIGYTKKGDTVVISTHLPKRIVPSASIMYRSLLSTTSVAIDGKTVYTYGDEYAKKNLLIPKHYNFVPIEKDMIEKGALLEITFNITENDAFTGLSSVYYGSRHEIERTFLQERRLPLFIGLFLCLFAFMQLTLSSYLYMYHRKDLSLIYSSMISFCLGAYSLDFYDIFCFIAYKDYFFSILEYIALYSIPFAIIAFLLSTHPELNGTSKKVILAINVLFPIITTTLQVFNIVHMNVFVTTLHILAIAEGLFLIPQMVKNMYTKHKDFKNSLGYTGITADSVLMLGLLIFMTCSIIDIVKYNFVKLFGEGGEAYTNIHFMIIGALCFVLCLFVFYFFHGIEHRNADYMKEHLEGLAYTDALTGLMNRAKCMQYMASVRGKYAIISLDLDNLKPVNDTLGHMEGDRMLRSFADIMKQSFVGAALIGRTGGDEFLVIIENPAETTCDEMLSDLQSRLEFFNNRDDKINLSASYGYAYSNEVPSNDANDVFMLADSRMYKIKEEHHAHKMNRFVNDIMGAFSGEGGAQ